MRNSTVKILKAEENLGMFSSGKTDGKININVKLMRKG